MISKKLFKNYLSFKISKRCCTSQIEKINNFEKDRDSKLIFSTMKKGPGNRASFNGFVVTVFGATGKLGKHVVNQLCKIGCQVIIPYRGNQSKALLLKPCGDLGQVLLQPFYLRDFKSINKAIKYSNVVINIIGKFNETSSFLFEEVHIDGARAIAKAAKKNNISRFIHVSALNVNPAPVGQLIRTGSHFLRTKYFGELAVREEFPEATIFRPSEMYSEIDSYLNYYSKFFRFSGYQLPLWNKGKDIFKQPVFMRDVALGIVNSIFIKESIGRTVDAAGLERYELNDLVKFIMRSIDKGEKDNYIISELRTAFIFLLKVLFFENLKYPFLCFEKLEFENISDTLSEENLNLTDLNIKLTKFNEIAYLYLKILSRIHNSPELYKEKIEPPNPISII